MGTSGKNFCESEGINPEALACPLGGALGHHAAPSAWPALPTRVPPSQASPIHKENK